MQVINHIAAQGLTLLAGYPVEASLVMAVVNIVTLIAGWARKGR